MCRCPIYPKSCAPFASLADAILVAERINVCSVGDVPGDTLPANFLTIGFPDGVHCQNTDIWIREGNNWWVSLDDGVTWTQVCGNIQPVFSGAMIGYDYANPAVGSVNIPNGTNLVLPFDTVIHDTDSYYLGTPGRLVAPLSAYYDIDGSAYIRASVFGDTGSAQAWITKNGIAGAGFDLADTYGGEYDPVHTNTELFVRAPRKTVYLEAGDYIELQLLYDDDADGNGNLDRGNSHNWLSMSLKGF